MPENRPVQDPFKARQTIDTPLGKRAIYKLDAVRGVGEVDRLPYSIKVLLEACLRNVDGFIVTEDHVKALAGYDATVAGKQEIPFKPGRVVLQDFTGVPAVVDLAAMREGIVKMTGDKANAKKVNPLVPCDLVIDHSVQVDAFASGMALTINSQKEFERNNERYQFLKWGQQAFDNFRVVPPATGIVHQVNLEYLAKVVWDGDAVPGQDAVLYPDSLVGTDSHTTMINGLGVVGWGVGGIEAEAVMLGQPVYMLVPEVVGFKLTGKLPEGATATDLVLRVTQMLRAHGVVGKFVEFFGPGLADMPLANRATIANMAPEYGATMGFFPVDEQTIKYMELTGRDRKLIDTVEQYCKLQGLWRDESHDIAYLDQLELDMGTVEPSLAGPRRPQDRISLSDMKRQWWSDLAKTFDVDTTTLMHNPVGGWVEDGGEPAGQVGNMPNPEANHRGSGVSEDDPDEAAASKVAVASPQLRPDAGVDVQFEGQSFKLAHGAVVIAAITSCTNTSNPEVMIAAGLVARKARQLGLNRKPWVKTSLAPGSKVVTEYYNKAGLTEDLNALGFNLVGYGCTTCIGNSGPLPETISKAIQQGDIVASSVLSGNRNFEGRINPDVKANYLASPPLVVAYAIAGTVDIDLLNEPIGTSKDGKPVYLRDIWPTQNEVQQTVEAALTREQFIEQYADVFKGSEEWQNVETSTGELYDWDEKSTYVQSPPFFVGLGPDIKPIASVHGARCLAKLGDSVTTDHISPAGAIKTDAPAGQYLTANGVPVSMFNSYGSRRGNDRVMVRGTFANVRVRNQLAPGTEGGVTTFQGDGGAAVPSVAGVTPVKKGEVTSIFNASVHYGACQTSESEVNRRPDGTPLIVLAGKDYGMGSSRDWAAKGTYLLGVKAVIAESYERIHRSNLVGMGVLPLQYAQGQTADTLGLDGTETFDIAVDPDLKPGQAVPVIATKADGKAIKFEAICRIDTPVEVEYYRNGGILHTVLRRMAQD
ncbi:aconitate hydratase [Phycisphaerales bacterium AB-hyl4]|uniref:Aconitate hydratase A n=1 Tax=Natronomicrosphaera hydrolytica TaxID=3242702 RepID=A0ABV4U7V2_9BACT